MTKDIPEIDDLLKGINDPEMTLTDGHTETTNRLLLYPKRKVQKNDSPRYRITQTIGKTSCPILKAIPGKIKEKG